METTPIIFENWESVLRTTVPENLQQPYREAIVKFRDWLQESGKSPDAETFKQHLEWKKSYLPLEQFEIRRDALRWYDKEGLLQMKAAEETMPKPLPPHAPFHHEIQMEDDFHRLASFARLAESMIVARHFAPSEQGFYCGSCPHSTACKAWHRDQMRGSVRTAA